MAGTKLGGIKASESNKDRHGSDFYKKIGSIGGKTVHKKDPETGKALKGFALNIEKARHAGRIGGRISRRTKVITSQEEVSAEE